MKLTKRRFKNTEFVKGCKVLVNAGVLDVDKYYYNGWESKTHLVGKELTFSGFDVGYLKGTRFADVEGMCFLPEDLDLL